MAMLAHHFRTASRSRSNPKKHRSAFYADAPICTGIGLRAARYPLTSRIDRDIDHHENDINLRRCRGTTCGPAMRGARKRGALPSSFCIPSTLVSPATCKRALRTGATASPLTNWPSPRRAPHPAKEAAASKSRSAFYRLEIRSPEGGLSPPAISCDESLEPSC